MKRILSLLIVGILIFTITGCGKNAKRKPITITLPEQDSEAILARCLSRIPRQFLRLPESGSLTSKQLPEQTALFNISAGEILFRTMTRTK